MHFLLVYIQWEDLIHAAHQQQSYYLDSIVYIVHTKYYIHTVVNCYIETEIRLKARDTLFVFNY